MGVFANLRSRISGRTPYGADDYPTRIPTSFPWNFWQKNMNPRVALGDTAIQYACESAYRNTIASLPFGVFSNKDGVQEALGVHHHAQRVLSKPNPFTTESIFWADVVDHILKTGNCFVTCKRNKRNEITEFYILGSNTQPMIYEGDVYYLTGDNPLLGECDYLIPARDVMNLRLHSQPGDNCLMGITPLTAARSSIAVNAEISRSNEIYFSQNSRPSGLLTTDQMLNASQMLELRQAWDTQSKNLGEGGMPILSSGLKFAKFNGSESSQALDVVTKSSVLDVCRAYSVPPSLAAAGEAENVSVTREVYHQWLASGLGFFIKMLEDSLHDFLGLAVDQKIKINTRMLTRMNPRDRSEYLTKNVQGGLMTVNESRLEYDGLPPVENGDYIRLQRQMGVITDPATELARATPAPQKTYVPDELDLELQKEYAKGQRGRRGIPGVSVIKLLTRDGKMFAELSDGSIIEIEEETSA